MDHTSPQFLKNLTRLERDCNYEFNDRELAFRALTHASYGDGRKEVRNNERLEFLGDRVLGLLTAELLFKMHSKKEGGMARQLNALVRKEACAQVAREIDLGAAILLSSSEVKQGGREKTSILGDACEAWLAAIYLDGGYVAANEFYITFWAEQIENVTKISAKDPKTELQESASAHNYGPPKYTVLERSGPDHQPIFVVDVSVDGLGSAHGTGNSKKDAERFAALHLLESWQKKT